MNVIMLILILILKGHIMSAKKTQVLTQTAVAPNLVSVKIAGIGVEAKISGIPETLAFAGKTAKLGIRGLSRIFSYAAQKTNI